MKRIVLSAILLCLTTTAHAESRTAIGWSSPTVRRNLGWSPRLRSGPGLWTGTIDRTGGTLYHTDGSYRVFTRSGRSVYYNDSNGGSGWFEIVGPVIEPPRSRPPFPERPRTSPLDFGTPRDPWYYDAPPRKKKYKFQNLGDTWDLAE